jgi:hypothetical protein
MDNQSLVIFAVVDGERKSGSGQWSLTTALVFLAPVLSRKSLERVHFKAGR